MNKDIVAFDLFNYMYLSEVLHLLERYIIINFGGLFIITYMVESLCDATTSNELMIDCLNFC